VCIIQYFVSIKNKTGNYTNKRNDREGERERGWVDGEYDLANGRKNSGFIQYEPKFH
jgi:hypothetical protein